MALGISQMYNRDNLAARVANRVIDSLNFDNLLDLSDDSLLKLAKEAASIETLNFAAEVNNTDTWQFANQANSNASFQATFLKAADILHCSDVLNRAVVLLKERRGT